LQPHYQLLCAYSVRQFASLEDASWILSRITGGLAEYGGIVLWSTLSANGFVQPLPSRAPACGLLTLLVTFAALSTLQHIELAYRIPKLGTDTMLNHQSAWSDATCVATCYH
jgi:hypothetical protein